MSLKFEKRQQIGAKGSMEGILGGGLAECAGRAEALEFGKFCSLILSRLCPAEGAADSIAPRTPPGRKGVTSGTLGKQVRLIMFLVAYFR